MQLGMNPSTAQHRLLKDIMWDLIVKTNQDTCCKCGCKMTRETFSIEHLVPWLDSDNPAELYFDLDNISFSHLSCNIKAARRPEKLPKEEKQRRNNERTRLKYNELTQEEKKSLRKSKYLKYGC
jgi:hypothetical protein